VNSHYRPDYGPLLAASKTIGTHMKRGAFVVFESTVDPGTTEDKCLPVIELASGMKQGLDFHLGYSPERINPGDPTRKLTDIKKIVAGCTEAATDFLEALYSRVVSAGLFKAASIRVAEAAKILENTQRDVNIALMNQMMTLFDKMGVRSTDVIAAASSKWNFHHYRPGLVGGHCIAVDPYFLIDAGRRHGLSMELVVAARDVNEQTPHFMVEKLEELMDMRRQNLNKSRVLVLGRTFKEDCPDIRNTRVIDVIQELKSYGIDVHVHDPVPDAEEARHEYGLTLESWDALPCADAIVVAVAHRQFVVKPLADYFVKLVKRGCFIDVKGQFDMRAVQQAGHTAWRL